MKFQLNFLRIYKYICLLNFCWLGMPLFFFLRLVLLCLDIYKKLFYISFLFLQITNPFNLIIQNLTFPLLYLYMRF